MTNYNKREFGSKGEELAINFLTKLGYEIIEQNYHFGHGEIDIIAKDIKKNHLVFVEVKSRKNDEFGPPELAVTPSKQRQLRKIASAYLYEKEISDIDCRMDVIAIEFQHKPPLINHIENAF